MGHHQANPTKIRVLPLELFPTDLENLTGLLQRVHNAILDHTEARGLPNYQHGSICRFGRRNLCPRQDLPEKINIYPNHGHKLCARFQEHVREFLGRAGILLRERGSIHDHGRKMERYQ
jgi:hypothetical protein